LSPDEEDAPVIWTERLAATGHPVKHSIVRELGEEIKKPRIQAGDKLPSPLSEDWPTRFLKRHSTFKTILAKNIENAQNELTREEIEHYFEEFQRVVEQYSIQIENIYDFAEISSL
jgi:hypothetical protein